MWIVTKEGFLSVVQNLASAGPDDALLVRARVRSDLDHLAEFAAGRGVRPEVVETTDADYRYRLTTSRETLKSYLAGRIDELNYPNFKNEVARKDPKRAHAYMDVWTALRKLQSPSP